MLEILNNRTVHTHENEQFRRVVDIIENVFDKLGYNGLLIGNPFNETFSRFRADALLLYTNGIILIDFKDYRGIIKLPSNDYSFQTEKWYNESKKDHSRLEIKAGSRFINPFKQLMSYRNAFKEAAERNIYLNGKINSGTVCIANIFSGPIEIVNNIPRNLPFYKIIQESELGNLLYDFSSDNSFSQETANILKSIFPAEKYVKYFDIKPQDNTTSVTNEKLVNIDSDVESEIISFLKDEDSGILVLESMKSIDRDNWVRFIQNEATTYNIPQIETWSHSSRISKRILRRANIETDGIYGVIYGGSHNIEMQNDENEDDNIADALLEIIPLKSSDFIDEKALIIIHEAQLISRSLNQSELLRFGSGRLLEDIISFLNPESNRKIVIIGDPYSLTYGKTEDSALNLETLSELYDTKIIKIYRKPIEAKYSSSYEKLQINLATSIENKLFNTLNYDFDNETLHEVQNNDIQGKLKLWFEKPFESEPTNSVLFYTKKDCLKTNYWIKKHYLKNSENISKGDLLIANNNVSIPDESGFQVPKKIVNGMFFTVLEVKESIQETIPINKIKVPILLSFTKLFVKCLSLNNTPSTELWILDNYFQSEDDLSREESIAFRVFIKELLKAEKSKQLFSDSKEYRLLLEDIKYNELSEDEKTAIQNLIKNYNLPIDKKTRVQTTQKARELLGQYNKLYTKRIFLILRETNPFMNALFVKYGWSITVHKALGAAYNEIIIKGFRRENDGVTNDDYFRWLYSGISASEIVNINSPQTISPFMNCVFEDNSNVGVITKNKSLLTFSNYVVESRFADKLQTIENENVVGAICEISKKFEQSGYILESTKRFTDYLTKVFFLIPQVTNKQLIINIDNKGAKENFAVANIRVENFNGASEDHIIAYISECLSNNHKVNSNGSTTFPTDFRKDIYENWQMRCKESNIGLKIIQNHNNQDVFKAVSEGNTCVFRVWYGTSELSNTKGFFSKIEILEKSSESIVNLLKVIVYGF